MSGEIRFEATVTALSPLHVGSGQRLREGLDFIEQSGYLWVASQKKLMRSVLDEAARERDDLAQAAEAITGMTLYELREAGWLRREHFDLEKKLFRYRLRGHTSTTNKRGELHEQIKDVYGRPYLPGSSLKGALRTVLAMGGARVRQVDLTNLGHSRKRAAQPIEKKIFGPDAKLDLLRALQVGDSQPIKEGVPLELAQVHVFPTAQQTDYGRSRGLDLDMEVLRKGTQFTTTIKLDETLFDSRAEPKLHFGKRRNWLFNLPQWARTIAGQRLAAEADFYAAKTGGEAARSFCLRLAAVWNDLQDNEFLLQLGWGAGWQSKTLGPLLQGDPRDFERLVRKYRLSPQDRNRKEGQPFPKSRKLVRRGEKPVEPLGWVKVRLERRA